MKEKNAHFLIVAKRSDDDEYGIVMVRDIAEHVLAPHRSPQRTNVYEIMQKPAISVHPNMDIRYCARLLDRFDLTRVPVVDNDTIVGMVSFTDLVIRGLAEREGLKLAPSADRVR